MPKRIPARRAHARRSSRGTGRSALTPGRFRRTRWALTGLFTVITALCLIVLGGVAASIDSQSRDRALNDGVDRVVTGLAREVYWDEDGNADLEVVRDDDLAQGTTAVAVLVRDGEGRWREAFAHERAGLPEQLTELAAHTADAEELVLSTLPDRDGNRVRVAAEPVWGNESEVSAVVFAAAGTAAGERDHRRLLLALELGGLALVAVAALAGHLLSGVSMRPAARMLAEQERFLADASHELRTPLTKLRLYLDAALRDPADARRAVTDARTLTDRMGRLVTGLLARTRAETGIGELDTQRLHLDQLVEGVVAESGLPGIDLRTEPAAVQADPDLLALAVRNLIDNAAVHGGAPIEVTVARGRVTVRDHGPGLDPALADPFERGATGTGGRHGIGLSIVRWVAQVHGGSVEITDAPDGGAVATLALPPAPEA
ncbi:sensor histidine kinase [Nocardia yamanashiensis]|uniref:sensor histidine kinase n=1 Tax=Nocardia yamanashiensis TaxID=209247 RepID=UPI000A5293DE|nr:HAMP domain-containing sensor histidine kinase [Nocardia yamanashiensis]